MCAKFQPDSDIEEIGRPQSLPSTNHSSNPPRVTLTLPETPPRGSTSRKFHVEVKPPRLSPSQMKQYKHSNESSLKEDPITRVDEVIGEYEQDGHLYYFARYQGGIARKVRVNMFSSSCRRVLRSICSTFLVFRRFVSTKVRILGRRVQ